MLGTPVDIYIMPSNQYVLATTFEYPSIILISLVDILKPTIVQIIGDENAVGYAKICVTNDSSQVFITNQLYLYLLQIQNQIILHTQIYLLNSISNSNEYQRQVLAKNQPLLVGQKIEMYLTSIYQTQNIIIRHAYYYFQNILQDLPSWISFQSREKILTLTISKDTLQKDSDGLFRETLQSIVFQTYQQVENFAFVNEYLKINNDDSIAIRQVCIKTGYMDYNGFIQPSYNPSQELDFGFNENNYLAKWQGQKLDLVKNFIQYTLNQNIINYTINFTIKQSIQVNLENKNQIISSIANQIDIQLQMLEIIPGGSTIPTKKAKFVNKSYQGVLILISSLQDQLKLEGTLENINNILEMGVKYSIAKGVSSEDILIEMIVSDGVNYDYIKKFPLKTLSFLSQQAPVTLSKDLSLQSDFNSKYTEGEIYIFDNFQYQISNFIFNCQDSPILQYSAQIKQGNQFIDIPKGFWMQFSPTDRSISGNPPGSFFKEHLHIQVNATDGYSINSDTFVITPSKIPLSYTIQLAIQILGPIFGLLGFYKYKHLIYNLYFKRQYIYSKDVIYVGQVYQKQITITNNARSQAHKLWLFFLNSFGEKEIQSQLYQEIKSQNYQINYEYLNSQFAKNDSEEAGVSDLSFEEEIIKKMYPFGVYEDEIEIIDRKSKKIMIESSQKLSLSLKRENTINFQSNSIKNSLKIDNYSIDADNIIQNTQNNPKQFQNTKYQIKEKRNPIKTNKNPKFLSDRSKLNLQWVLKLNEKRSESDYQSQNIKIFKDGKINFSEVQSFIKEKQEKLPEKKRILKSQHLETLLNKNSILSQAIACLLVEYLISLDKVTKYIFDFIQSKACYYYLDIDWYKAYVNIQPSFQNVNIDPYPQISIYEKTLQASLREIFHSLSKNYIDPVTKNPKEIKFSLHLLEEAIKSRAIGFSFQSPEFFQVTQGESLHTFNHVIHSVKTFERNNDITCCLNVHKLLDIHYLEKGLTDNEKLPSWIHSIDLINGVILIRGVPEQKDVGSILIKILDKSKFIVKSFEIQVLQKPSEINEQNNSQRNSNLISPQNQLYKTDFSQQYFSQLSSKIRLKKASTFARNFNQLDAISNQTSQKNQKRQDSEISLSSSFKKQYNVQEDQVLQFGEEQEIDSNSMRSPKENIGERKFNLVKSLKLYNFGESQRNQTENNQTENSFLTLPMSPTSLMSPMSIESSEKDQIQVQKN